jgi:hypothetical protein
VHAIALAHNGSVHAVASPEGGLIITVRLPTPNDMEPAS